MTRFHSHGLTAALVLLACLGAAEVSAKERSAKDQALFERARKDCSGPQWSSGARPDINYAKGTYKCVEPGSTRR